MMNTLRRGGIFLLIARALALFPGSSLASDASLLSCLEGQAFAGSLAQIAEERSRITAEAWSQACQQAREAEARRKAIVAKIATPGLVPLPGYASATRFARLAGKERDVDLRGLFIRAYRDQAARESLSSDARSNFAHGLSRTADVLLVGLISADAVRIDQENRTWLRSVVDRRGWFTIGRDGEDADAAAWFLVQHADADPKFQSAIIGVLEPLVARGESSGARFANLYDRWAAASGLPLRYGIQGRCLGLGDWRPLAMEAPEAVDLRRQAIGLNRTLAEEIALKSRRCSAGPAH